MSSAEVFGPDDFYDIRHASDFQSRFGAYLRQNTGLFVDPDEGQTGNRLEFAAAAWRVAQAPVMSPSYVTAHPQVLSAAPVWDFDGRLAVAVDIAIGLPRVLSTTLTGRWLGWSRRRCWSLPEDNDRPVATATAQFRVPMFANGLPAAQYLPTGEPDTEVAKEAIRVICGRLNANLGEVCARFGREEVA